MIGDFSEYVSALNKFPLLCHFPQIEKYHKLALKYLAFVKRKPDLNNGQISTRKLARKLHVPLPTMHRWINGSRPKIIKMLEYRLARIKEVKNLVSRIYAANNGIHSFSELKLRLKQLAIFPYIASWENLANHLNDALKYFTALELFEQGYLSTEVSRELGLSTFYSQQWFLLKSRPLLVQLARSIPFQPPKLGFGWLPLQIKSDYRFSSFIQVPTKITDFKQLYTIIMELKPLITKKSEKWKKNFGALNTFRKRLEAFAYLIGVTVSDAHIERSSLLSSCLKLALSKKYSWSEEMGERMCYYFGNFGIPVKTSTDDIEKSTSRPNEHLWTSEHFPFFSWFKQAILGLSPTEVKTYQPLRMKWILRAPKFFKKSFLQGLCDGDGSVTVASGSVKITATPNQKLILDLLRTLKIFGRKDGINVSVASMKNVNRLILLPIFLSAKSRLADASRLLKINKMKSSTKNITDITLLRRVLELAEKPGILYGEIRSIIADEFKINLRYSTIQRIIQKGKSRITISQSVVSAYFELLERSITFQKPLTQLIREVRQKFKCQKTEHTMYHWVRRKNIPNDVKLVLSNGYPVHDNLLQHFPHLFPFIQNFRY